MARPITYRDPHQADPTRRAGVNSPAGTTWGARVAPVTGRNSRKTAGWASSVAGGEYVTVRPAVRYARDADLGVRNRPADVAAIEAWHGFTVESAAYAYRLIGQATLTLSRREADRLRTLVADRMLTVPVS